MKHRTVAMDLAQRFLKPCKNGLFVIAGFCLSLMFLGLFSQDACAQESPKIDGLSALDWPAVLNNAAVTKKGYQRDSFQVNGVDDQWTGGSQDQDASPRLNWTWVNGNSNDKGDIANAGAVIIRDTLFFFGDRAAINGDAQIGFWLFKDTVQKVGNGLRASGFVGEHVNGDLLILSNFTNGGGNAVGSVWEWKGKTASSPGALVQISSSGARLFTNQGIIASPNGTAIFNGQTWRFRAKGSTNSDYLKNLFFEGFVALSSIQDGNIACYKRFLLETRNSQSINASLQDLTGGVFNGSPKKPEVTPVIVCDRDASATVKATCTSSFGSVKWYADANATIPITSGGIYSISPNGEELTIQRQGDRWGYNNALVYYATCEDFPCKSDVAAVNIRVTKPLGVRAFISPTTVVSIATAPPHFQLGVEVTDSNTVPFAVYTNNTSRFTYSWNQAQLPESTFGSLSSKTIPNPTFGAKAFQPEFDWTVSVQEIGGKPNCGNSSLVAGFMAPAGICPDPITDILCPNDEKSYSASRGPRVGEETWKWTIVPSGAATIQGADNGKDISIKAGTQNFTLRLTITYANPAITPLECDNPFTVKPTPVGSAVGDTICSGDAISITLNSTVANTVFTWTAAVQTAPTGGSLSGYADCSAACGNLISQTLSNSGNTYGRVRFNVSLSAENCPGTPFTVDALVKPIPVGSANPDTLCSGETTDISLKSTVAGTTFTYTATVISGSVSGQSSCASACGNAINQTLTNSGITPGLVRYIITPTAQECVGNPFTVDVIVNPIPTVKVDSAASCYPKTLTATPGFGAASDYDYSWTYLPSGVADPGNVPFVVASVDGRYKVVITDKLTKCKSAEATGLFTLQNCAHIFPTNTTCCNYLGGPTEVFKQQNICTTVSSGKISNAIPGVFFYYGDFVASTSGSVTVLVKQTRNTANNILKPFDPQNVSNVRVFVDACQTVTPSSIVIGSAANAGNATLTFNAIAGKRYVISVKYDTKSIIGSTAPSGNARYTFAMFVNGSATAYPSSTGDIDVVPNCSDNTPAASGSCPAARPTAESLPIASKIAVTAYPNPYGSQLNFKVVSPESGKAVLEVFDVMGRKLGVVFTGNVEAGVIKNISYRVPSNNRVALYYKLTVNNKSVKGSVMPE